MADATPGTIIVLNGCMSAGKTSIAKAIQRAFDAPYLLVGLDLFWSEVFPWEWTDDARHSVREIPVAGASPPKIALAVQPFGYFFVSGLHHTVAALARMGHHVVVDHVLYDSNYVAEMLTLWQAFPVWLVGVSCPLPTVLKRAAARTDRWPTYPPTVTWMFDEVHKHTRGIYDLEVDTSRLTPMECALQIKRMVNEHRSPAAFKQLAAL